MNIGSNVTVSDGQTSSNYVIKLINEQGIYISPTNDTESTSLLIQGPTGWQVYGTTIQYRITFDSPLFTYIAEVDIGTLNNLSDEVLSAMCKINEYAGRLCGNENLWIDRIRKLFGEKLLRYKLDDMTWKVYYMFLKQANNAFNQNININHRKIIKTLMREQKLGLQAATDQVNKITSDILRIQNEILGVALRRGEIGVLEIIKDNGSEAIIQSAQLAANHGHPEILKWMIEKNINNVDETVIANLAVQYRLTDLSRWLDKRGIYPDDEGLNQAAGNGDLETLQHYANLGILPSRYGANYARQGGHNNVVEWLRGQGIVYP